MQAICHSPTIHFGLSSFAPRRATRLLGEQPREDGVKKHEVKENWG